MSQRNGRPIQQEMNGISKWLIHLAALQAPESLSSRLEEEWLADLECRYTALSRLSLAFGCCWAAAVILSEYSRIRVPAATRAAAAKGYVTVADRNFGYFSLSSGTLFLILGLHGALFCGLVTTLSLTRELATQQNLPNHVLNPVSIEVTVLPAGL